MWPPRPAPYPNSRTTRRSISSSGQWQESKLQSTSEKISSPASPARAAYDRGDSPPSIGICMVLSNAGWSSRSSMGSTYPDQAAAASVFPLRSSMCSITAAFYTRCRSTVGQLRPTRAPRQSQQHWALSHLCKSRDQLFVVVELHNTLLPGQPPHQPHFFYLSLAIVSRSRLVKYHVSIVSRIRCQALPAIAWHASTDRIPNKARGSWV